MHNEPSPTRNEPSSQRGRVWLQSTGRATLNVTKSAHIMSVAIPDAHAAPQPMPEAVVETLPSELDTVTEHEDTIAYGDPIYPTGPSQRAIHRNTSAQAASSIAEQDTPSEPGGTAPPTRFIRELDRQLLNNVLESSSESETTIRHGGNDNQRPMPNSRVSATEPQSYLDEETLDWLPRKVGKRPRRKIDADHLLNQLEPSEQLAGVADKLRKLCTKRSGRIVLLIGCHDDRQAADTAALTAITTAAAMNTRVCLIDGDLNQRTLSKMVGQPQELGMANAMATQSKMDDIVWATSRESLDWIPAGNVKRRGWGRFQEHLTEALTECQCRYDLTCVYVPNGIDELSQLWAPYADTSYLIVSMQRTSQMVAQATVENLKRNGARLAGCIATDAPVDLVPASAN